MRHKNGWSHQVALLDIDAILLDPVIAYIIVDESFDTLPKISASDDKWLELCHIGDQQGSWLDGLQVPWAACEHAAYRPPSIYDSWLAGPKETDCDVS